MLPTPQDNPKFADHPVQRICGQRSEGFVFIAIAQNLASIWVDKDG